MTDYAVATGNNGTLTLRVTQSSQDIGGNGSWDHWELYLSSSYRNTFQNTARSCQVQINGNVYNGTFTFNFNNYTDVLIFSGDTWVPHNADGSKSTSVYGWIASTGTSSIGGPASVSGTFYQSTIPRASTATFVPQPIDAGNTLTIYTNRASTGFTHTLEYYFGGASGTINTGVADVQNWVVPMSLLSQIPNSTSGTGVIRTYTYNGGTYIGVSDTTLTITAPASVVPTFTTVTASEATAGIAANVGGYVQSLSKLNLALTGAAGVYGSSISSYKITVDGQTINSVSGVTPNAISDSGTVAIVGTITDSRGRTASKTVNVTVLAYVPPSITSITVQRALSSGTPDDNGTYIRANINAAVQSLIVASTQKNAINYRISTRPRGTSTWTVKNTTAPGGVTFNGNRTVGTFPIESSFDVLVEIYDDFLTSAQQLSIATAAIFMHWDSNLGVGIGKYRQQGSLDVLGQIFQNDGKAVLDAVNHDDQIKRLGYYAETISGLDLNTARGNGWLMGSGIINAPDSAWYLVENIRHNAIWAVQTAYSFTVNPVPVYRRQQVNGTWQAWQRLYDTAAEVDSRIAAAKGVPFAMATGTGSVTTSGSSQTFTVNFPAGRFTVAPVVTMITRNASYGTIFSTQPSTNSMTVLVGSSAAGLTVPYQWIAVQMTSGAAEG